MSEGRVRISKFRGPSLHMRFTPKLSKGGSWEEAFLLRFCIRDNDDDCDYHDQCREKRCWDLNFYAVGRETMQLVQYIQSKKKEKRIRTRKP